MKRSKWFITTYPLVSQLQFVKIQMKINKPKLPLNSTPIRPREGQNNYHSGQALTPTRQYENGMHLANLSPNKLNATKKPLAQKGFQGPSIQQQPQQMPNIQLNQRRESQATRPLAMLSKRAANQCLTHPNREGAFRILSDGEYMYCCTECSHMLANSGFTLEKVESAEINVVGANTILSSRRQSYSQQPALISYQSNPPPSMMPPPQLQSQPPALSDIMNFTLDIDPNYHDDPRFLQLQDFVQDCKGTINSFIENIQGFMKIQDHYQDQQKLAAQFYDAGIEYLQHIKTAHLNILKGQEKKYVQIAEIESGELEENKEVIEDMLRDISDCATEIVTNVDEENFNICMREYKQKIELYKHRVDEQRQTFEEISKLEHEELEVKLQEFRFIANDFFGVEESKGARSVGVKEHSRGVSVNKNVSNGNGNGMIRGGNNFGNNNNNFANTNAPSNNGFLLNNPGNFTGFSGSNDLNSNNFNGFGGFTNEQPQPRTGMFGGGMKINNNNGTTIPKANQNGPFRTLFGDDGTAQSPQFKEI